MSRKKRFQIKHKQRLRRHERLEELRKKNLNIIDFFYDGRYIGPRSEK
ncbi:hypothetical protein OAA99_01970 [Omnitrophica bacterium]|nr:hypothetical protein [Candidatus Omnitrophota bacterium]